ncbi:MAG: diacylglycerol kinase [Chitinophagales bacterium]|jgi:diacylglycerol kinase (ATP)|nr:diacylglycerol kinase family protein [Sphingobacteriales bacterium]
MRLIKSFQYAIQGILYCFRTQQNFKIHILGFIFLVVSAYYFQFEKWEFIVCLILSALVFFAELVNTAIESLVDLTTKEFSELAKVAKDCAAGAVLVLAFTSVCVWSIIVYGKI